MKTVSIKHTYWDIAADIYFPDDFNSEKKYPAIISAHPIGSCKEQTSGSVYGAALAKAGFIVIAFDASFQGSSGGEPRYLEDPTMRVKDFSIVVDGNDSNLLIVFYVQIMPDDFVMQLHRF
ncbi:hypothetical protein A1W1_00264 [Escherichia coli KTE83]|nr:hypothetical protein A139_04858 [Escherichia coli KTE181]ELE85432.1 hypothetical protein A1W1_00264 [Escherichia coli KTE83]ELJ75421.1 hypothetical protein WGM_00374 [Escherichia coli KTE82]